MSPCCLFTITATNDALLSLKANCWIEALMLDHCRLQSTPWKIGALQILWAIKSPPKVAVTQSNTLKSTYRTVFKPWPCWKRVKVSLLKAEKVLKPPQKPTVKNNRAVWERTCLWSASPMIKPKAKQAVTFTRKVPNGNWRWCKPLIHLLSPNLVRLPNPPPRNTAITSFIYYRQFEVVWISRWYSWSRDDSQLSYICRWLQRHP